MFELAADGCPKILPAYEDGIFKSVFTRKGCVRPLADIISSYIGISLTGVMIQSNELPIWHKYAKRGVFDINCTASDGKSQFAVEMQADPMKYDSVANEHANIRHRSIYCLANLHASQTGRGLDYIDFVRSYQITLCNYSPFTEDHSLIEEFMLRNNRGTVLANAIRAVFVDLSFAGKIAKKNIRDMTAAEKWSVFIAKADNPRYHDIIRDITKSKEEIEMAYDALTSISTDADERARFLSRRMLEQDIEHERVYWRRISREEGLAEGRAEGSKEKSIEIALAMLGDGVPVSTISRYVELSEEEIVKIAAGP